MYVRVIARQSSDIFETQCTSITVDYVMFSQNEPNTNAGPLESANKVRFARAEEQCEFAHLYGPGVLSADARLSREPCYTPTASTAVD